MTIKDLVFQHSKSFLDERGSFRKTFNVLEMEVSEDFLLSEVFHSVSNVGVFRGMHLQIKGSASLRSISLIRGRVIDVLLDLRPDSESFLETQSFEWDSNGEISSVLVPPGVAHGFFTLQEATLVYASNKPHDPSNDTGVNPYSLQLPFLKDVLEISHRDRSLPDISSWADGEVTI
jgi:dTDP-4-dehydrorhamnose 3,5-epimerase-like enzyme